MGHLRKACNHPLCNRVASKVEERILPTRFGFIKGRGTGGAQVLVDEMLARSRQSGKTLMLASFDVRQAFYTLDRGKLWDYVEGMLNDASLMIQVARRREDTIYVLREGAAELRLRTEKGVVVGDALGPLLQLQCRLGGVEGLAQASGEVGNTNW